MTALPAPRVSSASVIIGVTTRRPMINRSPFLVTTARIISMLRKGLRSTTRNAIKTVPQHRTVNGKIGASAGLRRQGGSRMAVAFAPLLSMPLRTISNTWNGITRDGGKRATTFQLIRSSADCCNSALSLTDGRLSRIPHSRILSDLTKQND